MTESGTIDRLYTIAYGDNDVQVIQRAASLQHADQILVLDDGHVVGQGTHAQLMESCEIYREVYESQQKGGEDDA